MKIGITYDLKDDYLREGFSPEDAAEFDSLETIDALDAAIQKAGHTTDRIGHGKSLLARLIRGDRWDLVFNIAEGLHGRNRESHVPALLEMYDIPYTFSDPLVCSVTLDKEIAKRLVRSEGLNTPHSFVAHDMESLLSCTIPFPLFIKPLSEGTSKGVIPESLVNNREELLATGRILLTKHHQSLLVEEFLPGREFTCAIVGNEPPRMIGCMEINILNTSHNFYSYLVKQEYEQRALYTPVTTDDPLYPDIHDLAMKTYTTLQCRDVSRIDIRCDATGKPSFIEVNPLPGLHPIVSDLPIIARQQGISYNDLIAMILDSAITRTAKQHTPFRHHHEK